MQDNVKLAIAAILIILFLTGCGICLYFVFKPKTIQSTTTTTVPAVIISNTSPPKPKPLPDIKNNAELILLLNKSKPTAPTDNGEITLNNISILVSDPIALKMKNTSIQNLFSTDKIYYDIPTKTYKLSPANANPNSKIYTGKPDWKHLVDILNHLDLSAKNNSIVFIDKFDVVPGLKNQDIQDMLTSKKIKYNGTEFVV